MYFVNLLLRFKKLIVRNCFLKFFILIDSAIVLDIARYCLIVLDCAQYCWMMLNSV